MHFVFSWNQFPPNNNAFGNFRDTLYSYLLTLYIYSTSWKSVTMVIIHQYTCASHTVIQFILKIVLSGTVSVLSISQVKKPRLRCSESDPCLHHTKRQDWKSNSHNWLSPRRCYVMLPNNMTQESSLRMSWSWPVLTSQQHLARPTAAFLKPSAFFFILADCSLSTCLLLLKDSQFPPGSPLLQPSAQPPLSFVIATSEQPHAHPALHLFIQRVSTEHLLCTQQPVPRHTGFRVNNSDHGGTEKADENKQVSKINISGECCGEQRRGKRDREEERGESRRNNNFESRKASLTWHLCKDGHGQLSSQRIPKFVTVTSLRIPVPLWHISSSCAHTTESSLPQVNPSSPPRPPAPLRVTPALGNCIATPSTTKVLSAGESIRSTFEPNALF